MKAVIQSGGKGTRLRPYTMILPKPLMPVGSKPVLELLLKWLRRNGIVEVYVTTGYLGHLIRNFCADGRQWGLRIAYTQETEPLGTIGALSLLREELDSTFLVINGDILTDLSLNSFAEVHRRFGSALTIATIERTVRVDFGIIEQAQDRVVRFREKPNFTQLVSTGIYCMEPEVLEYIPDSVPFGFDDLILYMLGKGFPVRTFLHKGMWLDIGRVEDFQKAQDLGWDDVVPAFETYALDAEAPA
ncbi:MAG: NTP transferase domain-containing protein [Acetobacteraceae bacterium]|nr:NTP transferase domain-containing protein [Acetobacteraceae bacterium]